MPAPGSPGDHPDNLKIMSFGKYKNKPFWYAYTDDDYLEWCLSNVGPNSCRGLKKFVEYINERNLARRNAVGYMGMEVESEDEHVGQEKDLVAILDSGCNKTCHGEEWFQRYLQAIQGDAEAFPLDEQHAMALLALVATSRSTATAR